MANFSKDFNQKIEAAKISNKPNRVHNRAHEIRTLVSSAEATAQRTGADISRPAHAISAACANILQNYAAAYAPEQQAIDHRADTLKQQNIYRRVAEAVALLIFLLITVKSILMGISLIICLLVARHFLKRFFLKQATALWTESWARTHGVMAELGSAETYQHPATGLYAEADGLYLNTLPIDERTLELQQRNAKKQRDQAAAHHSAMVDMQERQMAAQRALLEEQRMQTDTLADIAYTRPQDRYHS